MREIKFRAYDKEEKVMIAADDWYFSEEFEPFIDSVEKCLRRFELMQFTGLLDKNGTEIYEGDWVKDDVDDIGIVRFGKLPLGKAGDCVCTYQAFYVECRGQLGRAPSYECIEIADWMEVIGNIHQHPDLLKKESP